MRKRPEWLKLVKLLTYADVSGNTDSEANLNTDAYLDYSIISPVLRKGNLKTDLLCYGFDDIR